MVPTGSCELRARTQPTPSATTSRPEPAAPVALGSACCRCQRLVVAVPVADDDVAQLRRSGAGKLVGKFGFSNDSATGARRPVAPPLTCTSPAWVSVPLPPAVVMVRVTG